MNISQNNSREAEKLCTIQVAIKKQERADGAVILHSTIPLEKHPYRLTERLKHWATVAPERVFLGRKNADGTWDTLKYGESFSKLNSIAQALLHTKVSPGQPLVVLSENTIEHCLMGLAALHIGIPYCAVAPAYSLRSADFDKLTHVIKQLTPGLIFVQDANKYEKALLAISKGIEVVSVTNQPENFRVTMFADLLPGVVTDEVENAYHAIQPQTIAKILFTSGSTGLPKGVINTHENISTNWQQITQTFPFLKEQGLEFIDWLPWNHTFGGNHNLGLAMYNGGSFYIDDGNPTAQGIETTVLNLKQRNPRVYFNVPKGFEDLISYFKNDEQLRKQFFSNLKMLFYAGASMPQHVWDAWETLATETTSKKIMIGAGLGSTETCPTTLLSSEPGGFAGLVGVPVPGLELKLVWVGDKLEARYRGKNVFPGYWRQAELTAAAFDEEGFYCSGDALKFVDATDANKGMIFDGRVSEDFKLNTGTWVRVGNLRSQLILAGQGLIQDAVITGHDREFIGAIVFPSLDYCKRITGLGMDATINEIIQQAEVKGRLLDVLNDIAINSTGSASIIKRAVFADFLLNIFKGEITDKGSVNQRAVIQNHPEMIRKIYADGYDDTVIEIKDHL